jgi:hypothetical protein
VRLVSVRSVRHARHSALYGLREYRLEGTAGTYEIAVQKAVVICRGLHHAPDILYAGVVLCHVWSGPEEGQAESVRLSGCQAVS